MTEENSAALAAHRRRHNAEKKAIELVNGLIELANDSDLGPAIAEAISEAIRYEHPTKAQVFMRRLNETFKSLANSPRFGSDLRGAASKRFAQHCAQFEEGFPYV